MLELITDWSPLSRGVIAFAIAFGVSLLVGNKMILKLISMKLGQPVRSREEVSKLYDLHGKKAGTPTMGGVMIIFTLILAVLLCADLTNTYIHVSLFVLLGLGALGFKDDLAKILQGNSKGVSSKFKLVWQFGVAVIAASWIFFTRPEGVDPGALSIPFYEGLVPLSYGMILFGIIVIVGASNAVNLTDGLDGLASGCTITTGIAYTVLALLSASVIGVGVDLIAADGMLADSIENIISDPFQTGELAVLTLAMVGAVAGFLWFNVYPARVFMGDTGSLALGGVIGTIAISLSQEIILVLIGFIFVVEALSVMMQVSYFKVTKKTTGEGKRLLKCAPIHHHFELSGLKETQVISRFWIVSAICAGLGVFIIIQSVN
ncbi:phospho-N-acetylmuramoyl-pentapeptide-transferase [Akkermansiaceae bacterium]|nr:phospho-N-acetylmuramoyl-pentapeptide-transferase [Akkermansiaceae bacterium]